MLWDLSAAPSRLEEVTARRKTRDKEAETDEEEGAEEKLEFDPVTDVSALCMCKVKRQDMQRRIT